MRWWWESLHEKVFRSLILTRDQAFHTCIVKWMNVNTSAIHYRGVRAFYWTNNLTIWLFKKRAKKGYVQTSFDKAFKALSLLLKPLESSFCQLLKFLTTLPIATSANCTSPKNEQHSSERKATEVKKIVNSWIKFGSKLVFRRKKFPFRGSIWAQLKALNNLCSGSGT